MRLHLFLENIRLRAAHGVSAKERHEGSFFNLSLWCVLSPEATGYQSDALTDTVDYEAVYALAREVLRHPKCLIEHVAYLFAKKILEEYPSVVAVKTVLSKELPKGLGEAKKTAGCALWLHRKELAE